MNLNDIQTIEDARRLLIDLNASDEQSAPAVSEPDRVLGFLWAYIEIKSAEQVKTMVAITEKLLGDKLRSPEGIMLDADDYGWFNVGVHTAQAFVWATNLPDCNDPSDDEEERVTRLFEEAGFPSEVAAAE